jgi:hypothetical protein
MAWKEATGQQIEELAGKKNENRKLNVKYVDLLLHIQFCT